MAEPKTLAELLSVSYTPVPVSERLAWAVQQRQAEGRPLFTDIYGLDHELRRIIEVLMAGKGVLLTGTYGTAKTEISKQLADLLNEYHARNPVYVLADCPIQEEALNLAHSAGLSGKGRDACPVCRHQYLGKGLAPDHVPIKRLEKLVEGSGYARLQGSADVLPEEVLGSYNLVKLAQIGDPFDPRVCEPGKVGQANNGVLFTDEIGKLGEAGQYALIEASQEHQVTPAKSREHYSVDFLLVATTNPVDEDEISGAVLDRLVSIRIPTVSHEQEVAIVYKELARSGTPVYVPHALADLAVAMVRQMRASSKLELGSRACINACLIAAQSARLEGHSIASYCDIKEGVYTAVLGKARHAEKRGIEGLLKKYFPKPDSFLKKYFEGVDFEQGIKELKACGGLDATAAAKALKAKRKNIGLLARSLQKERPKPSLDQLPGIIASLLDSYVHGCARPGA